MAATVLTYNDLGTGVTCGHVICYDHASQSWLHTVGGERITLTGLHKGMRLYWPWKKSKIKIRYNLSTEKMNRNTGGPLTLTKVFLEANVSAAMTDLHGRSK
eukprot:4098728-Pyramimonas_sp.AAC.1